MIARRRILAAGAIVLAMSAMAQAYLKIGFSVGNRVVSIRWNTLPIRYFVTNRDIEGVSAAQLQGVADRAFATWQRVPGISLSSQFIGFTSRMLTMVWAGDDKRVRTLGREDAAYITIVPLWGRFMWDAAKNFPNDPVPWHVPAGVDKDDRGDHSKGRRGARMTLTRHYAKDQMEAEGLLPPEGAEGAPPGAVPPLTN